MEENRREPDGAARIAPSIHCLSIIGEIEGHIALPAGTKVTAYEHLMPRLAAIEEDPAVGGLLLLIHTVGGDVEAGLALAELISGMAKPTVALVLGGSHSIGVPLAVSARRTLIVPSATMTLHPVRFNGLVMGMPQTLSYFRRIEERILDFIGRNSRADPAELRKLMHQSGDLLNDVGSLVTGEQAVALGLCDRVGNLRDALDTLRDLMGKDGCAPCP